MIKRTLYFGNPAYLSLRNQQLVVSIPPKDGEEATERTIPIEDLGFVMLDNPQITITHGALGALVENNTAVVTCDSRHMPAGLLLPTEGNTTQSERYRNQIEASLPLRKQIWQQTVQAKIRNQAAALEKRRGKSFGNMHAWADDVRSGDSDMPNAILNYGYAILRAIIARALVGSGLLPTLGVFHRNRYNAYCLADDIMEPYRPYVDLMVCDILDEFGMPEKLNRDIKAKLLTLPTVHVVIDGKRSPLMIAASQTSASLARCYAGEIRKVTYPEM